MRYPRSLWFWAMCSLLAAQAMAADPAADTPAAKGLANGLNVPLAVTDFSGVNRVGEVVTGGVPLPRGEVRDLSTLRIVDADGKPVPCQFAAMDYWWADPELKAERPPNAVKWVPPSPSVRWLLVDFLGNTYPSETSTYYLRNDQPSPDSSLDGLTDVGPPAPKTPLNVTEDADKVTVVTGPLKFTVSKKAFNLIDEAWYDQNGDGKFSDDEQYVKSSPENGGVVTSGDWPDQGFKAGEKYYSAAKPPRKFVIEDNGPCRVCIRVDGTHYAKEGGSPDGLYDYRVRIQAFAGSPAVKVSYSISNMRPANQWKTPPIQDFEVATKVEFPGGHAAVFMLDPDHLTPPPQYREGTALNSTLAAVPVNWGRLCSDSRVTLYQDSSGGEQWKEVQNSPANPYHARIFGGTTIPGVNFRGFRVLKDGKDELSGYYAAGQVDVHTSGGKSAEIPLAWAVNPALNPQKDSKNRGLILTVRDFRQLYPKAIYGEKGRVAVKLFPEEAKHPFHVKRSTCRTYDVQFLFHGATLYNRQNDWVRMAFDNPLLPRCPAEWYARTQAWDMGIARTACMPLYEFDKNKFDGVRVGDEIYGWITPWNPGGQHYNECTQFAPWAARGDWGAFQQAAASVRWARDLVQIQTECPEDQRDHFKVYLMGWNRLDEGGIKDLTYPGYTDTTKWIDIPDTGHCGMIMLLEHYRLTGDRFSREAVERIGTRGRFWGRVYPRPDSKDANQEKDPDKNPMLMSGNRYDAWPLFNSMQAASLTGDKQHMAEARRIVLAYRNAVRYSPIGWMCPDILPAGAPHGSGYAGEYPEDKKKRGAGAVYANFQFGLVVEALGKYYEETGDPEARDAIIATCDVLVNRSLIREKSPPISQITQKNNESAKSAESVGKPLGWSYCWSDVWGPDEKGASGAKTEWNDDVIAAVGYGYRVSGRKDFLEVLKAAYQDMKGDYRPFSQVGYACVVHPRLDQTPPAAIGDLAASNTGDGQVKLTWTAPGKDGGKARATQYQIKYSRVKMVERVTDWPPPGIDMPPDPAGYRKLANEHLAKVCSFYQAVNVAQPPSAVTRPPEAGEIGPGAGRSTPEAGLPQPKPAGEKEEFTLKGLAPGKYWLAVKSLDAAENISDLSNVAEAEVK